RIGMTDEAALLHKNDFPAQKALMTKATQARAFFTQPDKNYPGFQTWLTRLLTDRFEIDAMALYLWPSKTPHGGLLGSGIGNLKIIDGAGIQPLLDDY